MEDKVHLHPTYVLSDSEKQHESCVRLCPLVSLPPQEVAEPLQDLKEGMEQLEKNKTLRYILSTLLAIGNFLNGTNVSHELCRFT